MKIIPANKNDYPELLQVWEASVRATHHFVREEDIVCFRSLVPQYFDAVDLFVIREGDQISGFLGTGEQEVQMLFLHPAARGKGLGKLFMQFAIEQQKVNKVEVNEQNQQAVGFYQHMGFQVTGRTELDYTGRPYPLLTMTLNTKPGRQITIEKISAPEILQQCAGLFTQTYSQSPWNDQWTPETALALLTCYYQTPDFSGWLAWSGDTLAGCALGNTEPHYSGPVFYLRELFVAPDVQRTGIGRYLINSLKKDLAQTSAKTIVLFTRKTVFKYYLPFGFEAIEDTGLMSCTLD